MSDSLFLKNVIFKDWKIKHGLPIGLEITHRPEANGEDYCSLVGTKQQINHYLQNCDNLLSERLRTLNSIPQYRIINTHKIRIQ